MKPKAIISLFNHLQNEALRQFLLMHEPMTVIAQDLSKNSILREVATSVECNTVLLEEVQSTLDENRTRAEIAAQRRLFDQYLAKQEKGGHFSPELTAVLGARLDVDLQKSVFLLESLEKVAEKFDIALFVTDEDITGLKKIATAWARSRGIPSLHFSHSIFLFGAYTVHDQIIADKVAVYGDRAKEAYLDVGYPENRMIVTGNLAWDAYGGLRDKKPLCRDALNQKYDLAPGLPLVVFGTTWASSFSSHAIETIYEDSLRAFVESCESLFERGIAFNAVVKDRWMNRSFGQDKFSRILAEFGADPANYRFAMDDTQTFAAAADALIAIDSNYLIEGMLARTPCINLMTAQSALMGPSFEAETGVIEVEPQDLADAVSLVLTDAAARDNLIQMGTGRAGYYNLGDCDGRSSDRLVQAMKALSRGLLPRTKAEIKPVFLLAPTSRLGMQHGFEIVKAYGNVIAAIDDASGAEHLHGVPRWGSEKFREKIGQYPQALVVNFAVSEKGKAWAENLCAVAGVTYLDFQQAMEKIETLSDGTPQ